MTIIPAILSEYLKFGVFFLTPFQIFFKCFFFFQRLTFWAFSLNLWPSLLWLYSALFCDSAGNISLSAAAAIALVTGEAFEQSLCNIYLYKCQSFYRLGTETWWLVNDDIPRRTENGKSRHTICFISSTCMHKWFTILLMLVSF